MENFLYFYQHLPLHLNPTLSIGFFSVSYYSLMYILGFLTVYCLLNYRIKKGEGDSILTEESLINLLLYLFLGLLIGARLGHVFFYNLNYFIQNPLAVISPFDPRTHEFVGIYGMSYFGGLIGVFLAASVFTRKYKISFWRLADFSVPAIPAGYFFGRIGNFINNELYGKITEIPWGMYFRDFPWQLRHPTELYEAFLEGILLFFILWKLRNKKLFQGKFLALYLIGYAVFRFIAEFFRETDKGEIYFSGNVTLGQIFSLVMIALGIGMIIFQKRKKLV